MPEQYEQWDQDVQAAYEWAVEHTIPNQEPAADYVTGHQPHQGNRIRMLALYEMAPIELEI